MSLSRSESIRRVISNLNSVGVGELSSLEAKLASIEQELVGLGVDELDAVVREARQSLGRGDMANFRRLVSQAAARLGHLA